MEWGSRTIKTQTVGAVARQGEGGPQKSKSKKRGSDGRDPKGKEGEGSVGWTRSAKRTRNREGC